MIAVWYLLISGSSYSGFVTAIPQESQQQCMANREWLREQQGWFHYACIQGVLRHDH